MALPLFRSEVSAHAQQAWLGRIVLIRPVSFTLLVVAAGAIALAIMAFLFFGEYTKKSTVSGMLVPDAGLVKVFSAQSGVVLERFAAEGDHVLKGAPLVIVGDTRHSTGQEQIAGTVSRRFDERRRALADQDRFLAELTLTERRSITTRREGLRAEATRIEAELRAMRERLALASRATERTQKLADLGFVSPGALDRHNEEYLDQELRLQGLERSRLAIRRELAAAESDLSLAEGRARTQRSILEGQRAALDQEQLERNSAYRATVTAPRSGTIASLLAQPGQAVAPGVPLVSIVPDDSRLEAHLFAPSRAMGFVRAGQEVLLRYPAFPFQKFGAQKARVLAVSRSALPASELGIAPVDGAREPLYRIRVALQSQMISAYGRPEALQAGMQVEADVLLDRRRLVEWIFEPLISLAGRA